MGIILQGRLLVVDAHLSNVGVGFVQVAEDVEIKVKPHNFTRHGLIHGKVAFVSRSAGSATNAARRGEIQSCSSDGDQISACLG
jgi:hypothetical protein